MPEFVDCWLANRRAVVSPSAMQPSRDYRIEVVDRTLDVLEALREIGPAALSDLAARAGCTRTAAFRLLRTLQLRGYAVQDEGRGAWRLGVRFPALGQASISQRALPVTANPLLHEAAVATGENVYLLQRNGMETEAEVTTVQPPPEPVRRYATLGTRLPLHAGPCRLLMAAAPIALQARLLSQKLTRVAPGTRTDRGWLMAELPRLRTRESLVTMEELFEGAGELAVPMRDASGQICAVVSILSPAFRVRPARQKELLAILKSQTATIETLLRG
jgi:DNA-binding IclR family transcriptional regulator